MKSENAEDRRALLRGGRRYVCAYGCARAWATLTFTGTSGAGVLGAPSSDFDSHLTFDIAFIAVSILVVLLFRRLVPLNENRVVKAVSSGCMAAASLLCVATAWIPGASLGLMVAGSLAAGVGYGLFLLLAAEVLATFSLLRIFLFLSGAMLLGSVITFFCEGLVGLQAQAMLVLLPLLATLCLQGAYEHVPAADRPKRGVPKFSYPWKLFVLYGLYAFAYGMRANQLVAGAGRHSSASTFILMAVLFATAASSYLIAISYSLMSFLVMFLLFDIAKRLGVAIVAFMAIKNAEQLLQLAGGGATDALGMLGLPASTEALAVTVIVSVLILAATVLLFSEKELASKWGVSILEEGGLVQRTAEEERAAERVEELSRTYRLSPREQEVLALLAEGKTGRVIQQELFIAEGTFKAHTRHIYEKMGINSRKELFELLGLRS